MTKCKNCTSDTCLECIRMSPNCKEKCLNIFCHQCFELRLNENDNSSFNTLNFFKCKICNKIHCKYCENNNKCNVCSLLCCLDCTEKCNCCEKFICIYCYKYYETTINQSSQIVENDTSLNCKHIISNSQYNPIIIGGYDGRILNFNLLNSRVMGSIQAHSLKSYVTSLLKFNDKLITSSSDGFLKVWKNNNLSGKIFEYSNNDKHMIHSITQTIGISDTLFAASTFSRKQALLFYSESAFNSVKLIKRIETDSNLNSICKLNESLLVLGGSNIYFWYLPKNEIITKYNIHDNFQVDNIIKLRKTNATIASTAGDNKLKIWNEKGKVLLSFDNANIMSSNYCKIAELNDGRIIASTNDFKIKIFDLKSKDTVLLKNHTYFVHDFSVMNDYNFISCSGDYTIATWDTRKTEKLFSYTFDDFYPMRILNPSNNYLNDN